MRYVLFALVLACASHGFAQYCTPRPMSDALEAQMAVMPGTYDIVGKDPVTHRPYAGRMQVEVKNNVLIFRRTVNGKTLTGKGRFVECTPDKIPAFEVLYPGKPADFFVGCRLSAGLDNDIRATCDTSFNVPNRQYGLEAWFQKF